MIDDLLKYLAPHPCCGCGKVGLSLCDNCKYDIVYDDQIGCIVCGRVAVDGACVTCKLPYQKAWCVGERSDTLRRLVDGYKFRHTRESSKTLSQLLDARIPQLPPHTIIVPIPTISTHIRQRGYDHTLLIARQFAAARGVPVDSTTLRRSTNSVQRLARSRRERFTQASAAFRVNGEIDRTATYVIIDDVITSGATLQYAAKHLLDAGAQRVWVGVIARQPSTENP